MFAAGNRNHLAAAIWSFAVCTMAQALQLGLAAGPSKLNLSARSTEVYLLS